MKNQSDPARSGRRRVLLVLPSLGAGGAERVISFVAQHLNRDKFEVLLLVAASANENKFQVDGVKTVYLNQPRVSRAMPGIIRKIRSFRPDVVLGAIEHLNAVLGFISLFFPKIKFIGREVNVMSVLKTVSKSKKSKLAPYIYSFSYKKLDGIICQSEDMRKDFERRFPFAKHKIVTINNPITIAQLHSDEALGAKEEFKFITVGRLAKQKGHLRILEALSAISFPFNYTIVGDGPEKQAIFNRIKELHLEEKVTHIPFSSDVPELLAKSDLFLQGSYVEGFPNALLESCAMGTPVLAFKAPGGIDEIIQPGVNGYIADDIEDFTQKIEKLAQEIQQWHRSDVSNSVYSR
jgi:glycosyltransferase involved in cell wall biosynthesis